MVSLSLEMRYESINSFTSKEARFRVPAVARNTDKDEDLQERHIIAGFELIADKPFILNDFRERQVNWGTLRNELSNNPNRFYYLQGSLKLAKTLKAIEQLYYLARYDNEAKGALGIIRSNVNSLWDNLQRREHTKEAIKTEGKRKI